jgi:hypothetical protein
MQLTKQISYSRAYFLFSFNSTKAIRSGIGVLIHSSPKRNACTLEATPSEENASRSIQNVGRKPVKHGL